MREERKNKPRAIVVIRLSALGDVAMTIPAVYDLCEAFPDLTIVFVTRAWMTNMMVNCPSNLVTEGIDLNHYKGVAGMWRLAGYLSRTYDIEAFIDLHDVLRTKILRSFLRLKGVKVSVIDKGRKAKKELVKKGARVYFEEGGVALPTTDRRYRDTILRAGYEVPERFDCLYDKANVSNDGIFRVGIAPFAAHQGKIYPLEKMAEVVRALCERPDTEIYLFGAGADESEVLSGWAVGHENVVNMAAAKKGLAAELELMSGLDVMLAMDSGNMHLASIAGTPRVVSIWGATHPSAGFAPYRARETDMVGVDTECSPCSVYGNRPCRHGDYRCLNQITPEQILNKILERNG